MSFVLPPLRGPWIVAVVAVAAAAALSVPAIRHWREAPPPPPPAVRLALAAPAGTQLGAGDTALDAAIAPDGRTVAFVATPLEDGGGRGIPRLYRRALDAADAVELPGTEGARFPAWKPTGGVIAFFANGWLKQWADGTVHDLAPAPAPAGAAWLADGSLLFAPGPPGPIRRLRSGQRSDATTLADGDVAHEFPSAAAGQAFVYVAVRADGRRVVRLADGPGAGTARDLTATSGHAALVGDQLLHVRDGVLLAYRLDAVTRALAPRGTPLTLEVGVSEGHAAFAASPDLVLTAPAAERARSLVWLDETGARQGTAGDAGDYWQVRVAPDERAAAVTVRDPLLRALDVAVVPLDPAGLAERISLALAADSDPVWAPDGARLAFRSLQGGQPDVFTRRLGDADAPIEPLLQSALDETPTDWRPSTGSGQAPSTGSGQAPSTGSGQAPSTGSGQAPSTGSGQALPGGGRLLFHARTGTSLDVLALDAAGGAQTAIVATPFNERDARWSPDGRWIAYVSDDFGQPDIFARRGEGQRQRVTAAGGTRPRWGANGRTLYFLRGDRLMRADLDGTGVAPPRLVAPLPGIRDFDVGPRSGRLLAVLPADAAADVTVTALWNWSSY